MFTAEEKVNIYCHQWVISTNIQQTLIVVYFNLSSKLSPPLLYTILLFAIHSFYDITIYPVCKFVYVTWYMYAHLIWKTIQKCKKGIIHITLKLLELVHPPPSPYLWCNAGENPYKWYLSILCIYFAFRVSKCDFWYKYNVECMVVFTKHHYHYLRTVSWHSNLHATWGLWQLLKMK